MTVTEPVTGWLPAEWPAPDHVHAGTSLRDSGFSSDNYSSLNLAMHVGDNAAKVDKNRELLIKQQQLPARPEWLNQTHSNRLSILDKDNVDTDADGSYTTIKNNICAVLTADCVPVLLCDKAGTRVAAVHAGWRGISTGIIDNAAALYSQPEDVLAWIGPCISCVYYEVGSDVFEACMGYSPNTKTAFQQYDEQHWHCDLVSLVKCILANNKIHNIYESGLCTYADEKNFYSYRRDGVTGRTASMIWME